MRRVDSRVSSMYREGRAFMARMWRVSARDCKESVRRGVFVSGANIVILWGLDGFGSISMGSVVAVESSRVGCRRQYLSLSLSQRSMLDSFS